MKRVIFLLFLVPFLFACSKDSEEFVVEEEIDYPQELNFIYKGVEYYSRCETVDDEWVILDDEVREVKEYLSTLPNLSTVVYTDEKTYYYDSYEETTRELGLDKEISEDPETRSFAYKVYSASVTLYENTNYGKLMDQQLTYGRLSVAKMDKRDKLSSLKLGGMTVLGGSNDPEKLALFSKQDIYITLFDIYNFEGESITFFIPNHDPTQPLILQKNIPNLKKHSFASNSKKNWNDEAASYILGIRQN